MSKKNDTIDEMIEKGKEGKLSRRQFSQLLAATGITMVAQPVLSGAATAQEEQAFYFTWGGYDIPELFVEYREKHGVNPDWAPYDSADGGLTKVRAGYVVDVMHPCNGNIPRWVEGGQLLPLDTAKLSHGMR